MKLYLHIGLPRTASTFLQNDIFPELNNLKYFGPKSKTSHTIGKLLRDQNPDWKGIKLLKETTKFSDTILASDEGFSMQPWSQDYTYPTDNLKKIFEEIEIILFLRHPTDWVLSLYGLAVQKFRFMTLEEFLGFDGYSFGEFSESVVQKYSNWGKTRIQIESLRFSEVIKAWRKIFPRTHVFFFEDFISNREKVLSKVLNLLDSNLDLSEFPVNQRRNYSPSIDAQDTAVGIFQTFAKELPANGLRRSFQFRGAERLAIKAIERELCFNMYARIKLRERLPRLLDNFFVEEIACVKSLVPDCPWR